MTYDRLREDMFPPEERMAHALAHIAECMDDIREDVVG